MEDLTRPRKGSAGVNAVFEQYRDFHPRFVGGAKEEKLIHARLADGFTVDDLRAAVRGIHLTPHNLGMNERGQKYLGLALCMRDASQVTRFMETTEVPKAMTAKNRTTAQALLTDPDVQAAVALALPPHPALNMRLTGIVADPED